MMRRGNILIIDPEPMMTESLRMNLEEEGYTATTAGTKEQGRLLFDKSDYDLILIEPKSSEDFLDFIRRIKETRPLTEVIVMTGYSTIPRAVEATKAGAFNFIEKPFDFAQISDLIERALERKRLIEAGDIAELRRRLSEAEREVDKLRRSSVIANPIWEGRRFSVEPDYCFLLMPFGAHDDIQEVYENHTKRVVQIRCGLRCERADDIHSVNGVMQSVWESINKARLIIAEVTGRNSNVFYELGIAHTLGKPVIIVTQSMDFVPFDMKHLRCIVYEFKPGKIESFEDKLEKTIKNVLAIEMA